jgi:hypothetical protein
MSVTSKFAVQYTNLQSNNYLYECDIQVGIVKHKYDYILRN